MSRLTKLKVFVVKRALPHWSCISAIGSSLWSPAHTGRWVETWSFLPLKNEQGEENIMSSCQIPKTINSTIDKTTWVQSMHTLLYIWVCWCFHLIIACHFFLDYIWFKNLIAWTNQPAVLSPFPPQMIILHDDVNTFNALIKMEAFQLFILLKVCCK